MIMKGLVILLLAVLVVESTHLSRRPVRRLPVPHRAGQEESASSLGGAQVGTYSHTRGRPRGRFPAFFPRFAGADEYASSLGGAPVGVYYRRGRLARARLPALRQPVDTEYAASLGGAHVGVYRKGGQGGRRRDADVSRAF